MKNEKLASETSVARVVAALAGKGYEPMVVETAAEALEKIKELVPAGASVMNGSSVTLEQIGFIDYLKSGKHQWNNLHAAIVAENEPAKKAKLRKEAVLADYYLGSVHALAETGEFVNASNTGSQLPHIVFASPNLIFVVSTKKIVPTLPEAIKRLEEHVVPLEQKQMMEKYHTGTALNKLVIFKGEYSGSGRKIRFILVKENLGF